MVNLATRVMGLNLKNPIIVSSCNLTRNVEGIEQCAKEGAAAVVLKSLFEEQIDADVNELQKSSVSVFHTEELDYLRHMGISTNAEEYLKAIEQAKEKVDIPIIASLNCINNSKWTEFSRYIEAMGADAIELNIAILPNGDNDSPNKIENQIYDIVSSVKHNVNIPVSVKLGSKFTSIPRVAKNVRKAGASALVLFNRFYQVDLDIETFDLLSQNKYSTPLEISDSLRWIAILYQKVGCSLIGNTGIHDGQGLIKQLLVGAKAVEICSTLYMHGLGQIGVMLNELKDWMVNKNYESLDDFRGIMSQKLSSQPEYFERQQYIKALIGFD